MYKILLFLLVLFFSFSVSAEEVKKEWCSLKSSTVNVRTGPGKRYPIKWVYKRAAFPMKRVAEYDNWIKVEDFEGNSGWIHPSMASDRNTFIVTGDFVYITKGSAFNFRKIAKLEKGVIGKLLECTEGLCKVEAGGWQGYVSKDAIWGGKNVSK